jgi:hypothetical protein
LILAIASAIIYSLRINTHDFFQETKSSDSPLDYAIFAVTGGVQKNIHACLLLELRGLLVQEQTP